MPKHPDSQALCASEPKVILSKLNHAFTPPELAQYNQKLSMILGQANNNADSPTSNLEIEKIIDQRAKLVESLLNNLDEQPKRCFAAYEVKTNDFILQEMSQQRSLAKEGLAKISKASKGIKKYQQV